MKKVSNYIISLILVMLLVGSFILFPMAAKAESSATTLAELRQELKNLQAKKTSNENKAKLTQSQINQKNLDISNAKKEIENSEVQITQAKNDIEDSKVKITELEGQIEELMTFYQQLISDNAYLEFITDSSSMTDLIMRSDAIKELTSYNKEKLAEAEELIKTNEQRQVDLVRYEEELNNNIVSYQKKIEELDSDLMALEDISMDINEEIKIVQTNIKMYESMGCGENQKFTACASYSYNGTWLKPVTKGSINSLFGYRTLNGKTSYHSGIDIGVSEGTSVYSATNGRVVYVIYKSSCGGNQVYIESNVNGVTYTMLYAHLLSINVSLNQQVTNQTVIGKSGGSSTRSYDSCTFGAHLHYSVSKSNWTTWKHFYANLINPPGFPGKGAWFYSRTQWYG